MTFKDYKYKRPDKDAYKNQMENATKKIRMAKTAEDQILLANEMQNLNLAVATMENICYIRYTINTEDPFYKEEQDFFDTFSPLVSEKSMLLSKEILASPFRKELEERWGKKAFDEMEMQVKSVSSDTVELMEKESALENRYTEIMASAKIDFDGKVVNLAQLGKYKENSDPSIRKSAYIAEGEYYQKNAKELDDIFAELVSVRNKQAEVLGFDFYTDFSYTRWKRLGYDKNDVETFRESVAKYIVPIVGEIKKNQSNRIGVSKITLPDDNYLFSDGNPTPKGDPDHLLDVATRMYSEMSTETKEFIKFMNERELFDLVAAKGKALGGYCTEIPDYASPFIFSNFNGTSGDVDVLTHEAGHAFNSYINRHVREFSQGHYGMEVAETHSMSMEFFAEPWYRLFFGEDTNKYKQMHMEQALSFIPYGCMVDEFQHYIYDNPNSTVLEKNEKWLSLESKYRPYLDISEIPHYSEGKGWQRQSHIYTSPFYYIDYCLAQTMALRMYMLMCKSREQAWEKYMYFVKNSTTQTFTELIESTSLISPFKKGSLSDLGEFVRDWLSDNA